MTNILIGSSFDDFLRDEGINEEASATAAIRVLSWQLRQQIEVQGISRTDLARRMGTCQSQVDQLLNADGTEIKLSTPERSAKAGNRETGLAQLVAGALRDLAGHLTASAASGCPNTPRTDDYEVRPNG